MKTFWTFCLPLFFVLSFGQHSWSQPLDRIVQSLPIFVACAGISSSDGALEIGIFSEKSPDINAATITQFRDIRSWNHESVVSVTGHSAVNVQPVAVSDLAIFSGDILWVLDASTVVDTLVNLTRAGVYTIGIQEERLEDCLFTVLHYENKSQDKHVERWRLVRFAANCEISPLRYNSTATSKDSFVSKNCGE